MIFIHHKYEYYKINERLFLVSQAKNDEITLKHPEIIFNKKRKSFLKYLILCKFCANKKAPLAEVGLTC
jgi:hypothetical protein